MVTSGPEAAETHLAAGVANRRHGGDAGTVAGDDTTVPSLPAEITTSTFAR